jgi:hypothetical protein
MRTLAWCVGIAGWFILCFAAVHWAFGLRPVWAGAVQGAVAAFFVLGLNEARRRGWIRGWGARSQDTDGTRAGVSGGT